MPAGRVKRSRGSHFVHPQRWPFIQIIYRRENLLPIIVIAQNSFDLSLTDNAFVDISLSPMNYRDKRFFMHTVIKVSELALWKKYTVFLRCCCNLKKSCFVLFNATAEFMNCSLFSEKSRDAFLQRDLQKKKLCQNHWKFTATFIGGNISIPDIALKNWDLSVSPRAFLKLSIIVLVPKGLSWQSLSTLGLHLWYRLAFKKYWYVDVQ